MKVRLLVSVSVVALIASSFVARGDDLETYQSALAKLTATPDEARSAETRQDIQKLQALVQQQLELKKNEALAQQAEQQLPTLRQQYQATQPAYDAQAQEVAKKLDQLDALNKMYSGMGSAQAKLTQAIKDQQAAEKRMQSMSPNDPGYAAALKDMATKQYLAGVAADVVKDPKNGLAKLQSAQQDYNEAKARLDQLNKAKNDAGQKLKAATTTLNDARDAAALAKAKIEQVAPTQLGGAASLINKATSDVSADLAKVAAAKGAAAPVAGGAAPVVGANVGAAGLINNGGSTLISPNGGTLVGNSGGTLVSDAGGTLVGNAGGTGIVAQGAGNLAGSNGIVAQGAGNLAGSNGIVAQGAGNLAGSNGIVAQGAGNLAGSNGIVAQGAGNLAGSNGIVAQGAGNLVTDNGSGIVAQGAGNIIGTNSGSIVAQGAGNLAGSNGIVAQGAGNLAGGNGIVAQGAGNIIGTNSGSIVAQGAGNMTGIHAYRLSSVDSPTDVSAETARVQADIASRTAEVQKATKDAADARAALAAAQSPYDAKAQEVAKKLDQLDALNKMYSGSASASAKLTQAIKDQQAAEKRVQGMSPNDPNYAAALKDMATKQYLAGVAADVVKDPKNGLAKLQSARQDYNETKAQLDQLNKAKNDAAQKIQDAQARINSANSAIKADNDRIAALKTPTVAGGTTFSPVGGPAVMGPAGNLVNNGGSSGGTLISPNGGTLVSQGSGNGIVAQGAGNLAGSNGIVAQGAGNLAGSNGIVAQGAGNLAGSNGIVAQGAGNLAGSNGIVAQGAGNLAGSNGIVAQGAGNLAGSNGIVAQGAGNLAGSNGIVAQGAGNLAGSNGIVAQGAGNLAGSNGIVAQGAGNLVTDNGSGIVAQGAGNIIGTNSGSIVAQGAGNLAGTGMRAYKLTSVDSSAVDVAAETQKVQADIQSRTADVQKATKDAADARAALAAAQSPYDAKATEVATKLDQIDALKKMYSGAGSAQAKLTQAIKDQQAAEKKVQALSPKDPNYAAALKDMATKQYLAGVAADTVKDPKNGLAKLQSAQQDYNEVKAQLDQLNKAKNDAAQKIQDAQARINSANSAIKADNDKIVSLKTAASSGPSKVSPVGGPLSGGLAPGGTLVNNGGTLISPNGGTIVSPNGGTLISPNGGTIIGTNSGGIVAQGAGNVVSDNGLGIVAQGAGNIVAQGAGNIVAQGAGNLAGNGAAPIISTNGGGIRALKDSAPVEQPAQTSTAPKGVAGGGFAHETQITISGNYDSGPGTGQTTKPATTVVASAPAAATPTVSVGPSTIPKNYDPNDWTTWPKADVASFLPPGKSVQQFKAGAEQDLATYKKNLAALPTSGLTKSQQDQKAGMEAQIRSLEFQVDTANRALGLPNATTTTTVAAAPPATPTPAAPAPAPVPVMSAAAIAATVTLPGDLAAAQQRVNDRAQQMASANQQLQQWQSQRATTTDPEKLKGLDAAISSAKFQLDVMQQALDRENKNVTDLRSSAAKTAALTPPAAPAAAPAAPAPTPAVPAAAAPAPAPTPAPVAAAPLKITATEHKGLEQALRTIPGKLSAPEKKTFNSLSVLAEKAVSKGLTAAEGAQLMQGIRALAQRHPKGIERYKLTNLANPSHNGPGSAGAAGAHVQPAQGHAAIPAAQPAAQAPAANVPVKPGAIAKQMPVPAAVKPEALKPHEVQAHPGTAEHGPAHNVAAPAAAAKLEPAKPASAQEHPAHHPVAAPAAAAKLEPPKPAAAQQHSAPHPVAAPKPEMARHHPPAAHAPVQAPKPAVAAPPKPHVVNVPKPVAAAAPPKPPKPVAAPPKPAAPVMPPQIKR